MSANTQNSDTSPTSQRSALTGAAAANAPPANSAPHQPDQIRFLAKVVPWQQGAFINIHTLDPAGGFQGMPGRAYTKLDHELMNFITWQAPTKNVYVCMSTQREAKAPKTDKRGLVFRSAMRSGSAAVTLKSLWLDLDAKGAGQNSYDTIHDAGAALKEFIKAAGLPTPTVVVNSGNGMHVHWTLDRPLPVEDWKPLASALTAAAVKHGLKFDHISTDAARVLRVPDTYNHKTTPAKNVKLVHLAQHDYPVEEIKKVLEPYKTPQLNGHSHEPDALDPKLFPPLPPVQGSVFSAGIDPPQSTMSQHDMHECLKVIPNDKLGWVRWNHIGMAVYAASAGEDYGLEEWKLWTAKNPHADGKDTCDKRWQAYHGSPPRQLTGGTLVHEARIAVGDPTWSPRPRGTRAEAGKRAPLKGGMYSRHDALEILNSHYFVGTTEQETAIFRIQDDGSPVFVPPEQFRLEVQNIFVQSPESTKRVPAEKYWKEHPHRHQLKIVFKPGGATEAGEHNLWQGYGVATRKTRRKLRSLLRHIWRVLCRRDKEKFEYLIRWLAWAVQNPDKHPGVVIVLKSKMQGTGKSTLGVVMLRIFGRHGALVDDKDRLLGRFNDWLEPICCILAEEILWAGDHKAGDKLKSVITADTIQMERKFGGCRSIPNRLHVIMTTNHDHAVAAGVGDRRFVVLDVSDEHAGDKAYFDRLYQDLDEGGTGEFLELLQNVDLKGWHPRKLIKTAEATEQQRMSGDSFAQWAQACINDDVITGPGPYRLSYALGTRIHTTVLREAYTDYCKQHGLRAATEAVFGKACTEMFGPRQRCPAAQGSTSRLWGYDVPDGEAWQETLNAYLGIK